MNELALAPPQEAASDTAATSVSDALSSAVDVLGIDPTVIVQKGLKAVLLLVIAWLGVRLLKSLTMRMLTKFEGTPDRPATDAEQRMSTMLQLVNSVGVVVIAIAVGLSVLSMFIDIGPLLAGVGVLGLAVSFGAQSLVKDVISGFFILFENQFDVGDVVEIGGISGVVERLTLRVVAIRDIDGVIHIIPNGTINQVSNKTSGWARAVLDVGVAYKEEVDRVIETLNRLGAEFWEDAEWGSKLAEAPIVMGVNELGDSSVVLRLQVKTMPGKQWEVKRELRRRIKNRFDQEGIEIPFPQRTLHVQKWPGD